MNRILFDPTEYHDGHVVLNDARAEHIRTILHGTPGQTIKVGEIDGMIGTAVLTEITPRQVVFTPHLEAVAPEPWFDILLAVPRPRAMKRLWPQLAALGVGRILLVRAEKVEKSYFSSHCLRPEIYRPLLVDGLMQAGTTRLPEVIVRERFTRLMREELDTLFPVGPRLLAHPGGARTPVLGPARQTARPLLAVGPDGGWTDPEIALFKEHAFQNFALGTRPLRTDTACIALIAVLAFLLPPETALSGTDCAYNNI